MKWLKRLLPKPHEHVWAIDWNDDESCKCGAIKHYPSGVIVLPEEKCQHEWEAVFVMDPMSFGAVIECGEDECRWCCARRRAS